MNFSNALPRRTVLSFGAFDLSNPVLTTQLRTLHKLGDELIIGCATDAFADLHGLDTGADYAERRSLLEHCRYVDRVIAQQTLGQIRTDIVNYNVGAFVMGVECTGMFDDLNDIAQVIYLPGDMGSAGLANNGATPLQPLRMAV